MIANDVSSSTSVPMFMVPRQRVDTSNEVRPSPMVRYRMVVSWVLAVRGGPRRSLTRSTLGSDRSGCTVRWHGHAPDQFLARRRPDGGARVGGAARPRHGAGLARRAA